MLRGLARIGIAFALGSCRLVAGIDDRVADHTDAATPPTTCTAERRACAADEPCRRVVACLDACTGDPASVTACRIKCGRTLPTSFDDAAAAVMACESGRFVCGGYVHPNAVCEACATSACCAETTACAGAAACLELETCRSACATDDGPCRLRCAQDHAAGAAKAADLDRCIATSCAAPCFDSAWSCLGRAVAPADAMVSIDIATVDFVTNAPLAGVAVRHCPDDDATCTGPVLAVTDSGGAAHVTVPPSGCLAFDGDALTPTCGAIRPSTSVARGVVPLVRVDDRDRLFGRALQAGTASIVAFVHDCAGNGGANVSLASTRGAHTVYWRSGRFVDDAVTTDASGLAAMLELAAPDRWIVRAEVTSSLPPVGQIEVTVRPDRLTFVELAP